MASSLNTGLFLLAIGQFGQPGVEFSLLGRRKTGYVGFVVLAKTFPLYFVGQKLNATQPFSSSSSSKIFAICFAN